MGAPARPMAVQQEAHALLSKDTGTSGLATGSSATGVRVVYK